MHVAGTWWGESSVAAARGKQGSALAWPTNQFISVLTGGRSEHWKLKKVMVVYKLAFADVGGWLNA